jgi:hypothetical protein
MILELTQPRLAEAEGLGAVGESVLAVLGSLADGDPVDVALVDWQIGLIPPERLFKAVADLDDGDRLALYEAVEADFGFDAGFQDPRFEFEFPRLSDPAKAAAKGLFEWLYEGRFCKAGFLVAGTEVSRTTWEASFREANREVEVCPACVSATLPEPLGRHSLVDADHYLPKSIYPLLAVHGLNLVPICQPCNGRIKLAVDPLGECEPPHRLHQVWFPYRRAAVNEVQLTFDPAATDAETVGVDGDPAALARAERYDRVFLIFERWSRKVASIAAGLPARLVDLYKVDPADAGSIRTGLELMRDIARYDETRRDGEFVAGRYYQWLLDTPTAFEALVAEIRAL